MHGVVASSVIVLGQGSLFSKMSQKFGTIPFSSFLCRYMRLSFAALGFFLGHGRSGGN